MFINDVLDFDESELLIGDEDDFYFFDNLSYSSAERIYFDCCRFIYFCPYCGCNLKPKLFDDCVHVVCPACTAGFLYENHVDFLQLVKDTTKQDILFKEVLPF